MGLFAALTLLLGQAQENAPPEIQSLVEKLGSDDIDERSRASARLRKTGRDGLPLLKKAAEGTGEEAARARNLVRLIETDLSLSDRVRRLVPKAAERMLAGEATLIFLQLTDRDDQGRRKHPDVSADDLQILAAPAVKRATDAERIDVFWRVGEWNLRSAVPELVRWLAHPDANPREEAVTALGRLDARETAAEILKLLEDPSPTVRGSAARVLGELGAVETLPQLVKRLADKGESRPDAFVLAESGVTVRAQAAASLCLLNDPRGVETILQDWNSLMCWGICLNALRRRDVWDKLATVKAKPAFKGLRKDVLEALAAQGGLSLDVHELGPDEGKEWLSQKIEVENLGARSVRALLEERAYRAPVVMVLEPDRIRLLSTDNAVLFWREWAKGAKPPERK